MYIKEILKAIMTQKSTKKKAHNKKINLISSKYFFLFAQYFPTIIIKKLKFPHCSSSIT